MIHPLTTKIKTAPNCNYGFTMLYILKSGWFPTMTSLFHEGRETASCPEQMPLGNPHMLVMSIHFSSWQSYFQPVRNFFLLFSPVGAVQYFLFRWLYSSVSCLQYIPVLYIQWLLYVAETMVEYPLVCWIWTSGGPIFQFPIQFDRLIV